MRWLPTDYTSPNAPDKRDVLGTAVLSMLSGHKRYAHMAALRADGVLPELLGLTRVMSEDAVRRGLKAIPDSEGIGWLSGHLDYSAVARRRLGARCLHDDQAALRTPGGS